MHIPINNPRILEMKKSLSTAPAVGWDMFDIEPSPTDRLLMKMDAVTPAPNNVTGRRAARVGRNGIPLLIWRKDWVFPNMKKRPDLLEPCRY